MLSFFAYNCESNSELEELEINADIKETKTEEILNNNAQAKVNSDVTVTFTRTPNTYWYGNFVDDFGNVSGYSDAEKNRHKITNSNTLSVKLLKNEIGQTGGAICDIEIQNATEYILKYKIKFQDGFQWKKGGKLPGLGGGQVYAGGEDTSVGDGWSFRPVWHFYSGVNNNQPYFAPYAYYVDQPGTYGDEFGKKFTIQDNAWYNIWIRIKMNTGTLRDGIMHMKVNNSTVHYDASFRWVTQNSGREIDELMWDIFRGGVGSDYIATEDNLIYFDTFVIDMQ
tara:strand:- start:190 stop:1035 length:846 start_codon:yes stop_codon:yes gene_type:complete